MHSPNPRESRHVLVTGLPETIPEEKINSFFTNFGGVQGVDRCPDGGVIVSFTDIRSARKAHNGDHRLDSTIFRLSFYDPATPKNPLLMAARTSTSPQTEQQLAVRRRSVSPWREKFDEWNLERNIHHRLHPVKINTRNMYRKDTRGSISPATRQPLTGLQGFYVEKVPRGGSTIVSALQDVFRDYGTIADIQLEDLNGGEERRGLVIFNSLKEIPEKNAMINGQRCRVRSADTVDVTVAYNKTIANKGAIAASTNRDAMGMKEPEFSVYSERACRTMYVGCLESNPTEQSLRRRFERYGTILEIDIKNPESPMPFAFLHFTDMESVVNAVNYLNKQPVLLTNQLNKKIKINFGRPNGPTNKIWMGRLPLNFPDEFMKQRLRMMFEGAMEVIYDPLHHQAIVRYDTNEHGNFAYNAIRKEHYKLKCDGHEYQICADFANDSLVNYFRDRLEANRATSGYLSPPPIPPMDMPSGYSKPEERKHSPQRRSRSRERKRSRSRKDKNTRGGRSSSNDSSSSSAVSGRRSGSSSSSSEESRRKKKRAESRERRSTSRSSQEKVRKPELMTSERATTSGDNGGGYETERQLEPPPAPPTMASPPPIGHRRESQLSTLPPQYIKPPPTIPPPEVLRNQPPPMLPMLGTPQPLMAQPVAPPLHLQNSLPRGEIPQFTFERRDSISRPHPIEPHQQLVKKPSLEKRQIERRDEEKREKDRDLKDGRPASSREVNSSCVEIPYVLNQADDPRSAPFYPVRTLTDIPLCIFQQNGFGFTEPPPQTEKASGKDSRLSQLPGLEERKRSTGSVHSSDARRTSGGSLSRDASNEDPSTLPTVYHLDDSLKIKQRSDSMPAYIAKPLDPPATPTTPFSAGHLQQVQRSNSGNLSFEERMKRLKNLKSEGSKSIRLSIGESQQPSTPTLSGLHTPPVTAQSRPHLQITIPPNGTLYNQAVKYDTTPKTISPKVDNSMLRMGQNTPGAASRNPLPNPNHHRHPHPEQQPSPLLSAPPQPPLLPKIDQLKSPPITPGSGPRFQNIATPSPPVVSRTSMDPFKRADSHPTPTTPQTPRTPFPPVKQPHVPERKDSVLGTPKFGSPNQIPPKQPQPIQQRHESMTAIRSPPTQPTPVRSMSVSDAKKKGLPVKDTSDFLSHLFNPNPKAPTSGPQSSHKFAPPIKKKSEEKEKKEHKKHKEHKVRYNPDGTHETKEQRAKRKAEKRARKLEKKKLKEKKAKEEEKIRQKMAKKEAKEKKEVKEKKKKRKNLSDDSDSDESDVDYHKRSLAKNQTYSDAELAALISGSTSTMYDRVKRRSSAITKEDEKKKALKAIKEKNKKKKLLVSSSDDDSVKNSSESESEKEEKQEKKKHKLEKEKHVSSSDSDSDHKPKKAKKARVGDLFRDTDIFGANSSDDEEIKPPTSRKSKTSTSDESDHQKKIAKKTCMEDLFGDDHKSKGKKEKHSPQQKQRKRQPSSAHEESQVKRSKRGSLSSDVSQGEVRTKSRENSVRKEETDDSHKISKQEHPQAKFVEELEARPKMVTKAAVKAFEAPSSSQNQLQLSEDSDDSEAAAAPTSQNISSSSSDSESDIRDRSPSTQQEEEHEPNTSLENSLIEPPAQAVVLSSPQPSCQYEPMFQDMEEPMHDVEGDLAAQAIADDQDMEAVGQGSIFDDCVDPIPEYPSHDFLRDDNVISTPVEISAEQIMSETFAEEPMPEDEEEEEVVQVVTNEIPPPMTLHTPPTRTHLLREENDFQSPSALAAQAVAARSPLSVAVDAAPVRTSSLFSPAATSIEALSSPIRSSHTPNHQPSPLVSPHLVSTPPSRHHAERSEEREFTQNLMAQARSPIESFYNKPTQQVVPLQHPQPQPSSHQNGPSAISGIAAVPSPSHVHSGTSSLSSPGHGSMAPSFEKKLPPLWKGRIIKNSSECTVQMHHLSGQEDYIRNALATLERDSENRDPALKLVQKMNVKGNAIYRLLVRLQDSEKSSTCLCIPCGNTVEEMRHHARVMKGDFVDYFQRKQCAGIAQMDSCTPASHIYVFGPNEFTDEYMKVASPKILERLQRKMADDFYYLFVAIAPIQPAPVSQD